jgi:hypothetical protein
VTPVAVEVIPEVPATFCGTPTGIADTLEKWFVEGAADGYNILPAGFVTVTNDVRTLSRVCRASCGCDCILPLRVGFVSEVSQCSAGDEVALNIEIIVDGGMDAEKALRGSC